MVLSSTQLKSTNSDALLYSSFIGFNDGCSKTFLSDLVLSNELPYGNESEDKNKEETSALGSLGLKPKPAH